MVLFSQKRIFTVLGSLSVLFALLSFVRPHVVQAQTFEAELKRVAKLRQAFGDDLVGGLTNLPPDQYRQACDKALELADQVASGTLTRIDALNTLCTAFTKDGNGCHAAPDDTSVISDSEKPEEPQDTAMENSQEPVQENSITTPTELSFESTPSELSAAPAEDVPSRRASLEPELESDTPPSTDREISSE